MLHYLFDQQNLKMSNPRKAEKKKGDFQWFQERGKLVNAGQRVPRVSKAK